MLTVLSHSVGVDRDQSQCVDRLGSGSAAGPQGSYVYVVKPDGTVESRTVSIVQLGNFRAVIGSGLAPGEELVVDGQFRIQHGSHVVAVTGQAAEELANQSGPRMEIP